MVNLAQYNTLRVPAKAKDLMLLKFPKDLKKLRVDEQYMFLGLGANVLFVHDFPGTIIRVDLKGRQVISQTDDEVIIEAAAGENWHELVMWTVENNWSGMENMALIPGTVGAAVVGNIACYGQNQEDVFLNAQVTNLKSQKGEQYNISDCQFKYRESIFKTKPELLVTSVQYKLSKKPLANTTYHSRFESLNITNPTPLNIANAVIELRQKKLPSIDKVGTAGSFFKNPIVSREKYSEISAQVKELQWYPTDKLQYPKDAPLPDLVKIPAARLLDELGWKSKVIGRVSTYERQALAIINLGGATGQEIFDYAEMMREDIKKNFEIELEYEVRVI